MSEGVGASTLLSEKKAHGGITLRSFLIGMICVVVLSILSPVADVLISELSYVAARNQAPLLATLLFFAVVFVNIGLKPFLRNPLTAAEQMVVYCMVLITAGITSTGLADYLIPHLVGPFYFASPENDFAGLFFPHIPDWLVPTKDPTHHAVQAFYVGGSTVPWGVWMKPLGLWSTFFLAMYILQFCIANVIRKQWVERERLAFPLLQLPLSIVQEEKGKKISPIFRDPLFWFAAVAISALYAYNSLQNYFPYIKPIPMMVDLKQYLPQSIVKYQVYAAAYIYPALIGFFYFATLEVSLSIAFFFVYYRFQQVIGGMFGVDWFVRTDRVGNWCGPGSALCQAAGAIIALVLLQAYTMRHHLRDVLKNTFFAKERADDSNEAIPYRWTVIGGIASLLYLCLFLNAAGMNFFLALALMVLLCFWLIALSRMVAEGGIVWGQIGIEPYKVVTTIAGTSRIGPASWTIVGYCWLFMVDMQAALMPAAVQTLKVSDDMRIKRRRLLLAMAVAILVCLPLAYYSNLRSTYALGGSKAPVGSWSSWSLFAVQSAYSGEMTQFMTKSVGPDWHGIAFIVVGTATMFLIYILRYLFVWWPIHPIGMTMMGSWALYKIWFSALLAFVIKAIILRFGGLKAYNRMKPVFLGMIFGGFVFPLIMLLINLLIGHKLFDVGAWP